MAISLNAIRDVSLQEKRAALKRLENEKTRGDGRRTLIRQDRQLRKDKEQNDNTW